MEEFNRKAFGLRAHSGTDQKQVFIDEDAKVLRLGPFTAKDSEDTIKNVNSRYARLSRIDAKFIAKKLGAEGSWIPFEDFTSGYAIYGSVKDREGTYIAYMEEIHKFTDVCKKVEWIYETPKASQLLETLVWLWVLRVSMQMQNVYVDIAKKTFWIIDLHNDISSKQIKNGDREKEPLFFLSRNPNPECKFFNNMGKYYEQVATGLNGKRAIVEQSTKSKAGTFEKDNLERLDKAIELLTRYYKVWEVGNGKKGKKGYEDILPSSETEVAILGEGPLYGIPSEKKGKMRNDKNSATTYSGLQFKVAIDWLAQHIREGNNEKAVVLAVELYHIRNSPNEYSMTHYRSFIKQLKIMAAKDIGVANYPLVLAIIDYLNRYEDEVTYVEIISIVIAMCNSEKNSSAHDAYENVKNINGPSPDKSKKAKLGNVGKVVELFTDNEGKVSVPDNDDIKFYKKLDKLSNEPAAVNGIMLYVSLRDDNVHNTMTLLYLLLKENCTRRLKDKEKEKRFKITPLQRSHVDKDGIERKTSDCELLPWIILDEAKVGEVNDNFWISNNILRYAYFKDISYSIEYLLLAIYAGLRNLAFESYALRFEEADPMDVYLEASEKLGKSLKP